MVKFKSPIDIQGIKEKRIFKAGEEFEMTVKRADELQANIQAQKGFEDFKLERVEDIKEQGEDGK